MQDRAFLLHTHGVTIFHEDLCHTEFLEDLFTRYKFTHVVHLAAQAGVRYSLQNPLAYIRANVECQVALLEVMRKYPVSEGGGCKVYRHWGVAGVIRKRQVLI